MSLPKVRVRAAPSRARLLLSLPQAVKYSSFALQPSVRATAARAAFSASSLRAPGPYRLEGLAQCSRMALSMTSATSGATMVVAALSR